MPAPVVKVVRFQRDHTDPEWRQPDGQLHHTPGVKSLGFMRGENLAVGQKVDVVSRDGIKKWAGEITQSLNDNWTPSEGPCWFFDVTVYQYEADPEQEDTVQVTVTVTDTSNSSGSNTAQPNPQDVP